MLTFDEIEPRKDPDLSIQAYYARLNPLSELCRLSAGSCSSTSGS